MDKSIVKFHKRRDKRLSMRGIRLDGNKYHGNTKLPFGLCKKEGIEIKDSWTPHDAWEALKGKGYDPDEEYGKLKERGSVKEELPKAEEKKKESETDKATIDGIKYKTLFVDYGADDSFLLKGLDYTGKLRKVKETKDPNDIEKCLKDAGLSLNDDEVKMSIFTKAVFEKRKEKYSAKKEEPYFESGGKRYKDLKVRSIGIGKVEMYGTEKKDGGICYLGSFSPDELFEQLKDAGFKTVDVDHDDFDLEQWNKERESNDPFIEYRGKRYTKIKLTKSGSDLINLYGIDKDSGDVWVGSGRENKIFQQLKDAGFKNVDVNGEKFDLENWEAPKPAATIEGHDYMSFKVTASNLEYKLFGIDEDGDSKRIRGTKSFDEIKQFLESKGLDINSEYVNIDDSVKKEIENDKIAEQSRGEREKKKAEEQKSIEEKRSEQGYIEVNQSGTKFAKDFKITINENDEVSIFAVDERGDTVDLGGFSNVEEAEDALEAWSVEDYEIGNVKLSYRSTFTHNGEKYISARIASGTDRHGRFQVIATKKRRYEDESIGGYFDTETEARNFLRSIGCKEFETPSRAKTVDIKEFEAMKKPTFGMKKVSVVGDNDTGYKVYADTKRFGKHQQMFEAKTEEECRKWLNENNVMESSVKFVTPLPNGGVIRNHTAKSLSKFDERRNEFSKENTSAARTIRDLTREQKQQYTDMMSDIFSTGAYRMRRTSNHFADIFIDGKFKNLFETGTSGGSTSTYHRGNLAEQMFGIPDDIEDKDREKYGYFGLDDDEDEAEEDDGSWYGDIMFKFKRESVEDNTTYTLGDSLNRSAQCAGYCGSKATIEGLSTCSEDSLSDIYDLYKSYKDGDISRSEFFREMTTNSSNDNYLEIQYHGELTTDKLESVMFDSIREVREAFDTISDEKRKQAYKAMKKLGIPIRYKKSHFGEKEYPSVLDFLKERYPDIDE